MGRPKTKESKALNIKLELSVAELLEKYCEETGLTKTMALERILRGFFTEIGDIDNTNQKSKE